MNKKTCKQCGADIIFSYVTPTKTYIIEGGKIIRNDAWVGPGYDDAYLEFYCSCDKEHDIECEEIIKWSEDVEKEFYSTIKITEDI